MLYIIQKFVQTSLLKELLVTQNYGKEVIYLDSVLNTIKKLLGIDADDDSFDSDICIGINSAILTLSQLGLEGKEGFIVTSDEQEWSDYLNDNKLLPMVQQYIHLKTKMSFDPPQNSIVGEKLKQIITELEWRIRMVSETNNKE